MHLRTEVKLEKMPVYKNEKKKQGFPAVGSLALRKTVVLVEGVWVGSDHHGHFLQGVSAPAELGPVDAVLVSAAVVPAPVPHAVQVGVGTGVIPPATLLVMGTVT